MGQVNPLDVPIEIPDRGPGFLIHILSLLQLVNHAFYV